MPAQSSAAPRPERKDSILLAAEKLFAQRGFHAVTIRQIADEAGVPLALVGYHYGQKHELFEAIFQHWGSTIDERLAGLKAAVQAGGRDLLRRIVMAFVQPVLRLRASPEGEFYALLVARELAYSSPEADAVLRRHFDPMAQAFIDALHTALPRCTRAQVAWAYQFALGALLHHLCDTRIARLSHGKAQPGGPEAGPMLVDFIVAGMRALHVPEPEPAATTTTRRRQKT